MKQQVIAEIKVIPLGTENTSLSQYVAACLDIASKAEGVSCQLTAMGTIVQGTLEQIINIAQKMHQAPFALGVKRVATTISIDDRRDKPVTMDGKVQAVYRAGSPNS